MEPSEIISKQARDICRMQAALEVIFSNTYRLEPSVYRLGVLSNIKIALGDERYEYLKSLEE